MQNTGAETAALASLALLSHLAPNILSCATPRDADRQVWLKKGLLAFWLMDAFPCLCRQPECGSILRGCSNSPSSAPCLAERAAVHTRGFSVPPAARQHPCASGSIRKPDAAKGRAAAPAVPGSVGARAAQPEPEFPDCRSAASHWRPCWPQHHICLTAPYSVLLGALPCLAVSKGIGWRDRSMHVSACCSCLLLMKNIAQVSLARISSHSRM
jgi:hypothetical protein